MSHITYSGDDVASLGKAMYIHTVAEMWAERIGFNAVYSVGGTLTRTVL